MQSEISKRAKWAGSILIGMLVLLVGAGCFYWVFGIKPGMEVLASEISSISESNLEKVLEISDLSTVEYTYNAVVPVFEEDSEMEKYYVAYEGIVKAGIDFEKLSYEVDNENKLISIQVPEVNIQDCVVNSGTLDYIFIRPQYDLALVSSEAYAACLQDLKDRAASEENLLGMARENSVSAIKGLVTPWVQQLDNEYQVMVC